MSAEADTSSPQEILARPEKLSRPDGHHLAYHRLAGRSPGVVFFPGYMSDMTGSKALAVETLCRERGNAFLRFDYGGHGQSSGKFVDGTIGQWADDAIAAFDALTEGPQILVGSSMGGWISLLTAVARKDRIAGVVGIAAAPDFTEDLMKVDLSAEVLATIERDGQVALPTDYGDDPYIITKALLDDGRDHLLLRSDIDLDCPVRLLQGMKDPDVPWQTASRISDKLCGDDVEITFIKNGDHRLSEPNDLARLTRTVAGLLDQVDGEQ